MKNQFSTLVATMGILVVALADTAQAEQCQQTTSTWSGGPEPYEICLLTDTSQPLVLPVSLQFKVPAKVTGFWVSAGPHGVNLRDSHLAGPGTEGTNLWEARLEPSMVSGEGAIALGVRAGDGNELDIKASFFVTTLAAVANTQTTVRSTKQKVTVTYSYEARTAVMPVVQLYLNAFPKRKTIIVTRRGGKKPVTGPGTHTFSVSIPRKAIKRLCKDYGGCFVLGWGRSWISASGIPERAQFADLGTYSPRKKVYTRPGRKNVWTGRTNKILDVNPGKHR